MLLQGAAQGKGCWDLPQGMRHSSSGQAARLTLQEELDLIHPIFSLCRTWGCELERDSPVTMLFLICTKMKKISS